MRLKVGDWVHRRYGYGDAQWGRICGRMDYDYDCWYVTATDGSVYHDNGHDLFLSTQPPNVPEDFAIAPQLTAASPRTELAVSTEPHS